ncbi:class II fumarate hydratase [Geothermobacter hydrogeniphilus]|uniref:Fumarate hydratase class II n=1 Tax=Geothermobacter hydrogeniphilus TaxID=1969733 RepID=A0A1X0XX65_9BACT|nr:class II fumarate hydratase [Geothermobacter hydrogeniphilus]ORJ57472.1 aspartate ammonia-lyase [Geothermobacter hydrogeniphilus]
MNREQQRTETDSMGSMQVPAAALYGAQTARAVNNFPVSGRPLPRAMIRALGLIKQYAARVNAELGLLPADLAEAIAQAAAEVANGDLDEHFPIDIFQTGSGTSSNMNANEVIANRAAAILGHNLGDKAVHPNDHVNLGQSSNDVFPSAIHLAAAEELHRHLLPALELLQKSLQDKAEEFDPIVKLGRTHLQDAVPIRLGQVFSGYARQLELARQRLQLSAAGLLELPLGGTAVGTGLNTHPEFAARVCSGLTKETGLEFSEARNHFEAQAARDAIVTLSGTLKSCAAALFKIANDIRLLASGPRGGYGELSLPAVQPGSSIMPGKVNPVMAESLIQVCAQVIGNDAAITLGGLAGNFELNVMLPLLARNLLESIELTANAARLFAEKCVTGLQANAERCAELVEQSLAMVTALAPRIGYDRASELAKQAFREGTTIRALCLREKVLPEKELNALLDPLPQTGR